MKQPRLFYWEDAEDCWAVASIEMEIVFEQVHTLADLDNIGKAMIAKFEKFTQREVVGGMDFFELVWGEAFSENRPLFH